MSGAQWSSVATHLITFVAGLLSKVWADSWTDRRRHRSDESKARKTFGTVEAVMPALLEEMRTDFAAPLTQWCASSCRCQFVGWGSVTAA
jgi:hypothetical protein